MPYTVSLDNHWYRHSLRQNLELVRVFFVSCSCFGYFRPCHKFCVNGRVLLKVGTRPSNNIANWLTASPQSFMDIVQRVLAFFIARYITLYIESSSGKLDLFLVTFLKLKFKDSIVFVV